MTLTKSFKEIVKARVERDPAFRAALFEEAIKSFLEGDTSTGKALLRDLVNSTIGFEKLAIQLDKPNKSLLRMLAPSGNPTMENLFQIISTLKKTEHIEFELSTVAIKKNRSRSHTVTH